jgi:ATP-dependent helicase/nuclease subunit B
LQEETQRAFSGPEARDWFSQAWRLRWEARIAPYIEWQKRREQEGWSWQEGEVKASRDFALEGGGTLTLYGRLDRIDRRGSELAVLDYKTESAQSLREKLNSSGEDVQLSAYALLTGDRVSESAFVSLEEKQEPRTLAVDSLRTEEEAHRLLAIFDGLHQGAKLPAQGIEKVCMRCDMRGLCRRDYWPDEGRSG